MASRKLKRRSAGGQLLLGSHLLQLRLTQGIRNIQQVVRLGPLGAIDLIATTTDSGTRDDTDVACRMLRRKLKGLRQQSLRVANRVMRIDRVAFEANLSSGRHLKQGAEALRLLTCRFAARGHSTSPPRLSTCHRAGQSGPTRRSGCALTETPHDAPDLGDSGPMIPLADRVKRPSTSRCGKRGNISPLLVHMRGISSGWATLFLSISAFSVKELFALVPMYQPRCEPPH